MNIKCKSCEHSAVCSRQSEYAKILDEIDEFVDGKSLGNLGFDITLDCKHYKTEAKYAQYIDCLNAVR